MFRASPVGMVWVYRLLKKKQKTKKHIQYHFIFEQSEMIFFYYYPFCIAQILSSLRVLTDLKPSCYRSMWPEAARTEPYPAPLPLFMSQ